jgi:hypothetical protein
MPAMRIEITVPEATYDEIEKARGDVPRAAWIKRAIDQRLEAERSAATR